jgi:hypothetical protein
MHQVPSIELGVSPTEVARRLRVSQPAVTISVRGGEKEVFMANGQEPKEIKINFPQELQGGVYSNNMVVSHTKEEFILDFIMVAPPAGAVTARVIVSPGHMKRILAALSDNILKYEKTFGTIQIAEAPRGKILS